MKVRVKRKVERRRIGGYNTGPDRKAGFIGLRISPESERDLKHVADLVDRSVSEVVRLCVEAALPVLMDEYATRPSSSKTEAVVEGGSSDTAVIRRLRHHLEK